MRPGKNILLCAALGLLALGLSTSVAVELTLDNYAELTAGKSVLLKLYAPWYDVNLKQWQKRLPKYFFLTFFCGHLLFSAGDKTGVG